MNSSIEINIEEIRLLGFAPQDRKQIVQSVELALTQMLQQEGTSLSFSGGAFPCADGGSFTVGADTPGSQLGNHIAQSVYAAISGL